MRLEVCIDSLESAQNASAGGADELELCSSLSEGGLTPSPGLVMEVIRMRNENAVICDREQMTLLNVMIRCRGGSNFCFTDQEMATMLSDIDCYRTMDIDGFVFGALTEDEKIDVENCRKVIDKAHPFPVTFHRAFDVCKQPYESIKEIINLGFKRVLTSGQKETVNDSEARDMIQTLLLKYSNEIEIMPGSGISYLNVEHFVNLGCKIVHSSCKTIRQLQCSDINMGSGEVFLTDANVVKKLIKTSRTCETSNLETN